MPTLSSSKTVQLRNRRLHRTLIAALLVLGAFLLVPGAAAATAPSCSGNSADYEIGQAASAGSCFDPDGGPLHITITQAPAKGSATVVNQDTSFPSVSYNASSTGPDTFKFKATDNTATDSSEVTVATNNVPATNDPPQCGGGFGTEFEIGQATSAGGCTDEEGDSLHITITQAPTKGSATVVNQDTSFASVNYTASSTGADTFKFKANDGNSDSNEATVTTNNVPAVNDPPQCFGPFGSTDFEVGQGSSAGSCSDDENNNLHITITQAPTKGSATVVNQDAPNASVQYTASSTGADTFKFKANDGTSDSNEVTVNTNNTPAANDSPQCFGPFGGNDFEVGQASNAGSCFDEENNNLHITITQAPTKGSATVVNQDTQFANVSYTASSTGADTFKFKANDGNSDSNEATVTTNNIPAANDPPQCSGPFGGNDFEVGQASNAGNCFDDEANNLHITITQAPTKGSATVLDQDTPDASVQYTASSTGADTFKFKANDGNSDSNEATVTTNNIPAANDPPQCFGPSGSTNFEVGQASNAGSCFDEENNNLHITITQAPAKGSATVVSQDTQFAHVNYTASSTGADTFKFKANDGNSDSNEVTVATNNVPAANDPPQCSAESGDFEVGQATEAGSCIDDETDALHITITQAPAKGSAAILSQDTPGAFVEYTASSTGADTFKFKANDGNSDSNEATVTTNNIPAANDPPLCSGESGAFTVGVATFAGGCSDQENGPLHITITQAPAKGSATVVNQDTVDAFVRYTASSTGADTFKFKANDGNSDSNEVTVTTSNAAAGGGGGGGGSAGGGGGGAIGGSGGGGAAIDVPDLPGGASAGSATVSAKGALVLKRIVDCTGAGPDCDVVNSLDAQLASTSAAAAKKKKVKLGKSHFTVKAGKKGTIKVKLTKKGLKLLKRLHKIKAKLTTTVKRGDKVTIKTIRITLKAPKKKK